VRGGNGTATKDAPLEVIGDPVLLRPDGRPAYNFAVVIDDDASGHRLLSFAKSTPRPEFR
jgi:hypothetical protein